MAGPADPTSTTEIITSTRRSIVPSMLMLSMNVDRRSAPRRHKTAGRAMSVSANRDTILPGGPFHDCGHAPRPSEGDCCRAPPRRILVGLDPSVQIDDDRVAVAPDQVPVEVPYRESVFPLSHVTGAARMRERLRATERQERRCR